SFLHFRICLCDSIFEVNLELSIRCFARKQINTKEQRSCFIQICKHFFVHSKTLFFCIILELVIPFLNQYKHHKVCLFSCCLIHCPIVFNLFTAFQNCIHQIY